MIKIDQTCVDSGKGNCQQAVVASILGLDLSQVPNFILYADNEWWNVYYYFMFSVGWQYEGQSKPSKSRGLREEDSINGFFEAAVPSRTFKGKSHAVIINTEGMVIHDPNPNKLWLGVNVLESGELQGWYMYSRVNYGN